MVHPNDKKMKHILLLFCFSFIIAARSQIGIGTLTPHASSALELFSLSKGLLVPRVSLSADLSNTYPVSNPHAGLLVFNSGSAQPQGFYTWEGTQWKRLSSPAAGDVSSTGPSTDHALVRFDGTSGKIIQNSTVLLSDMGNLTGVNKLTVNGFRLSTNPGTTLQLVSDASGNASWQSAPPIDVKFNNTLVVANATLLNFKNGIHVQDAGNNKASITFFHNNVTQNLMELSSIDTTDINQVNPVAIKWKTEHYKDVACFDHSNTANPSRITVKRKGIYEINFMFSAQNLTIKRQTIRSQMRKNGSTIIPHVTSYSFTYQYADNRISHVSSSFLIELEANDYIELITNRQTNDGEMRLVPNENVFFIRLMRNL